MRFPFIFLGVFLLATFGFSSNGWSQEAETPAAIAEPADNVAAGQAETASADAAETAVDGFVSPVLQAAAPIAQAADSLSGVASGGDAGDELADLPADSGSVDMTPVILLIIGIVSVLGMIIGLKLNAFLALIISALIVSLGVGLVQDQDAGSRMNAVVQGFGGSAGSIGIVIAMAAIIGKCMLDSGAADRIVRSAVNVTGEKKASFGLMVSGFILAIPVFFDTVFYLLVRIGASNARHIPQSQSA